MNDNGVTITTTESSHDYLMEKITWLLDLMDKEHYHAATHAQRNNYQAVIRIELQIMLEEIRRARRGGSSIHESFDIPF
jgi:hypothetical protein